MDLSSHAVIVTGVGATGGIGWSIARAVHAAGGKVLLHGRNMPELEDRAHELGDRVAVHVADLTAIDATEGIVGSALKAFGRLDGLVNNAGVFPRNDIDSVCLDDFETIFAVNARAPLFLCKASVAAMRRHGEGGSIVNIGSINAYCGQTNILAYSMSKGALQTMTRNLGDALGQEKIRVNQMNVGWTLTEKEHQTQLAEGQDEDWLDNVPPVFAPFGSILRPEQIAPHVVFWLSTSSWPATGQVYEVEQYPVIGRNKISHQ